jgi:hypothetical protein
LPPEDLVKQTVLLSEQSRRLMPITYNLPLSELDEMCAMLADLTPPERARLIDPNFITEDEADVIVGMRRMGETGNGLDEVLAEFGTPGYRRRT